MSAAEIGISQDDFSKMTPTTLKAAADGYSRRLNRAAWMNGLYFQLALVSVLSALVPHGKHVDYPKRPLPDLQFLTDAEKREIEAEEIRRARAYMIQMEQAWRQKYEHDMKHSKT